MNNINPGLPMNNVNVYRDQKLDPGPSRRAYGAVASLQHLLAAVTEGELPHVPGSLRRAIEAETAAQQLNLEHATAAHDGGVHNFIRGLHAHVIEGTTELPDYQTFAAQALEATHREQLSAAASIATDAFVRWSKLQLPQIVKDVEDEILDGLRAEITKTMDSIRKAATNLSDLDITDPSKVAAAADPQRRALTDLNDLSRRYNRLRMIQIDTHIATGNDAPGVTPWSSHIGWRDTLDSGIHEVRNITHGDRGPATDLPPIQRLLQLAKRGDVWLPTHAQMKERWAEVFNPKPTTTSAAHPLNERAETRTFATLSAGSRPTGRGL